MRQFKFNILLLILLWVVLAVIFGMYELEISKQLVNQNSSWAKFLENYGMIPGIFVILSGIYIFYSYIKSKTNAWSYIQKSIFFLVSSGLTYYLFELILNDIVANNLVTFLIISFVLNFIIFILLQTGNQISNVVAINYSKVVLGMALFGYVVGIQLVKFLWGRVRFRELDSTFSQFTPWYFPQGITGYDSFPSGHAAMGFMLLAILIPLIKKKKWIKNSALLIIILWGTVLAISRVVIGAHYALDVFFGSFFIILTFLLFYKYYFK